MKSVVNSLGYELPFQLPIGGNPNGPLHNYYYLIENSGVNEDHNKEKMLTLCQNISEELKSDCVIASSLDQISKLWSYRESITLSLLSDGYVYKYDISLPLRHMGAMVQCTRDRIKKSGIEYSRVVGYGHVGDGNLHLNITSPNYNPELLDVIEPYVYDRVRQDYGGSISAEHGIGLVKRRFSHYGKCPTSFKISRGLKQMFDPHSILNPYKVLP